VLPFGLLVSGGAAWVCAFQRLLGLDAHFARVEPDRGPDHRDGVDYAAVYTERYFDGVDSRFSPCGFRDDARYYDRLLEPLLEVRISGRALDVGCGYGYLTRRLARHFETTGIDVSEAAIRKCRATLPDVTFAVHEVEQPFPMPEGSFDVVTLTDVLEHLVDPESMLGNVRRVLKDRGILYVTTPNLNSLRRWLYAEADRREHHVSLMSRADLVTLLDRSGFRVLRSWTYVSAYMLPGRFESDAGPETGVLCEKVASR
jgi:SAM-dependent methyltransferase